MLFGENVSEAIQKEISELDSEEAKGSEESYSRVFKQGLSKKALTRKLGEDAAGSLFGAEQVMTLNSDLAHLESPPSYEQLRTLVKIALGFMREMADFYPLGSLYYLKNSLLKVFQVMVEE